MLLSLFLPNRSPLRQVSDIRASTLIFIGAEDTKVLPEPQGIALYRGLNSRYVPTELYKYPGNDLTTWITTCLARKKKRYPLLQLYWLKLRCLAHLFVFCFWAKQAKRTTSIAWRSRNTSWSRWCTGCTKAGGPLTRSAPSSWTRPDVRRTAMEAAAMVEVTRTGTKTDLRPRRRPSLVALKLPTIC